jgi:hemerythrin
MTLGLDIWSANIIGFVDNTEHKKIENKFIKKCIKIKKEINSGGKTGYLIKLTILYKLIIY